MRVGFFERLVSIFSYISFGIVGIVAIVIAHLSKKYFSNVTLANIYQSIFFAIVLYVLDLIFSIGTGFLSSVPVIGDFINSVTTYFAETPKFFGFTLYGLIIFSIICYLCFFALIGKCARLPLISDILGNGFRR